MASAFRSGPSDGIPEGYFEPRAPSKGAADNPPPRHDRFLTVAQRSALMAKVKDWSNAATELRLVAVFRALDIIDWRRRAAHCACGDRASA